jgi:chemotaxis regulatin CheY-phosphate phosphatase CheZ
MNLMYAVSMQAHCAARAVNMVVACVVHEKEFDKDLLRPRV